MRFIVLIVFAYFMIHAAEVLSVVEPEMKDVTGPLGLLLMLLGLAFMAAEVFVAGFGILGISGVAAFAFGSFLLFDAGVIGVSASIPIIIAFCVSSLIFFVLAVKVFLNSRSRSIVGGAEEMVGLEAEVIEFSKDGYRVRCHGEEWSAKSPSKLKIGERVEVVEISGLILKVKPIEE